MKRAAAFLLPSFLAIALVACSSTQPPAIASFKPASASITQGASTTLSWSVSGTSPVTLGIDHGIGDVTGKTSVSVTPAQTTTYTLTASNSAGKASKTTTVTVTAPTVTVAQHGNPPWIAVQDGSGAWTALTGSSFAVTDAAGRYGVAWACDLTPAGTTATAAGVEILQLTLADATSVSATCPSVIVPSTHSYTGTVANVPSNGSAVASIGDASAQATAAGPSYTIHAAPTGKDVALAYGFDSNGIPTTMLVTSLDVTANGTWNPDLSFGQPYSLATLATSNLPSGAGETLSASLIPGDAQLDAWTPGGAHAEDYATLPTNTLPAGHLYELQAFASSGPANVDAALFTSTPPATETLTYPSLMGSAAAFTVSGGTATASYGKVTFGATGGTFFNGVAIANNGNKLLWRAFQTRGWLGSATSYTVPDFRSTSGWNSAWDFAPGSNVGAAVIGGHTNGSLQDLGSVLGFSNYGARYAGTPTDGTSLQVANDQMQATY